MEFLDNVATCNMLLVSKRTLSIVLKTYTTLHTHNILQGSFLPAYTPHYIHTIFCNVLFPASTYTTLHTHNILQGTVSCQHIHHTTYTQYFARYCFLPAHTPHYIHTITVSCQHIHFTTYTWHFERYCCPQEASTFQNVLYM